MTVLFCDLVEWTALSERLDPEDLREIITAYRRVCSHVVRQFEGHIGSYVGDGLLIYFGYPRAHEDDARRAIQAGLAIVDAVGEWNQANAHPGIALSVRIGIHTGLLVVGDIGSGDVLQHDAIVGSTPNLAARLQALAPPNTVVISGATLELVPGLFVVEELGLQHVKGLSRAVAVYRVIGDSGASSPFEAVADRGLTPLVGRAEEIGLLAKRWAQAKDGEAQVVFLSGEPGIGKSRLIRGLEAQLAGDDVTRILLYCSPYHRNTAFYPIINHLRRAARFEEKDTATEKVDKLAALVEGSARSGDELMPLLASLLSLPLPGGSDLVARGPEEIRRLTLKILVRFLEQATTRRPTLMVVEDAQWIDPSTLELVGLIVGLLRRCRLLLLITFRPEFDAPFANGPNVTALTLSRLTRRESMTMVDEVIKGKSLPDDIGARIIEKTDGVPLFIEELTKAVVESGLLKSEGTRYVVVGGRPNLAVPASLHDSLMARLDRLAPVKEVAQLAAALGRTFTAELLRAVWSRGEPELEHGLAELIAAGLMYRRGLPPDVTYEFKHALVADAAYQSLLRGTRQQYHARIAHVLEARFPDLAREHPEILAHHFTEAGVIDRAVEFWSRAGRHASETSANVEAVAQISRALELLSSLAPSPERTQRELNLRIALNGPLIASKGYSAPDLAENFKRALQLCREIGDTELIFPVLYAQWVFHITTGKLTDGFRLATEFLRIAEERQPDEYRLIGNRLVGPAAFIIGNMDLARHHLERAIATYDPQRHQQLAILYGQDVRAATQCYLALALLVSGYPARAAACAGEALKHAKTVSHAHTFANALAHAGAFLHLLMREHSTGERYSQELIEYAAEHGLPVWQAVGRFYLGWVESQRGRHETGITFMRDGLVGLRQMNFVYWQPLVLGCIAEAHSGLDMVDEGVELLHEALQIVEDGGERWFESELHRIKGVLLTQRISSDSGHAEQSFRRAMDVARRQNAKLFELRAAASLGRLWRGQGRSREAKELISGIWGWFTEGHEVPDLIQAKTLLGELA